MRTIERKSAELSGMNIQAMNEHHSNINAYYDSPAIQLFEQMAKHQIHLGYFDERYPNVTIDQAARRLTQVVIDQIDIPIDAYFLDIGCGCGQPAMELVVQKKCYIEGITINSQQKEKAEAYALQKGYENRASFSVGDAAELPYLDEQFDGALMFESIHHIGHEAALCEAWRVLKAGSTIVIADGVVLQEHVSEENKSNLAETFVAKTLLTEQKLVAECYAAGFEEVEVIDLSAAIQPTWNKLMESTLQNRSKVVADQGAEFFDVLIAFWQQMNIVWCNNARYLIVKATKP